MATREEIENLIARVATGDRAGFRALYSLTSAKLFGVLLRVLNDRAGAEEALQDVYMKVWHKAGHYRANGLSPMTWLITIARNHAIDMRRRLRGDTDGGEALDVLADPAPGPEAQAIAASENARLGACLNELDEARADAVRLAYLQGETYAELAARFDAPLNTMRTWLRRSLQKLKECLSR